MFLLIETTYRSNLISIGKFYAFYHGWMRIKNSLMTFILHQINFVFKQMLRVQIKYAIS